MIWAVGVALLWQIPDVPEGQTELEELPQQHLYKQLLKRQLDFLEKGLETPETPKHHQQILPGQNSYPEQHWNM